MTSTVSAIKCAGCLNIISDSRFLSCSECSQSYDLLCANVPECRFYNAMTAEHKSTWKCQLCKCKHRKSDNTNTPVRLVGADSANSMFLQDLTPSALATAASGHDGSLDLERSVGLVSDNVGTRRGHSAKALETPQKFQINDTIADDMLYLDNIRSIIREELQVAINQRLTNIIGKAVSEQFASEYCSTISKLSDKVSGLEERVLKLEALASNPYTERDQMRTVELNVEKSASMVIKEVTPKMPLQHEGAKPKSTSAVTKTTKKNNRDQQDGCDASIVHLDPLVETGTDTESKKGFNDWTEVKKRRPRTASSRITRGTADVSSTKLEASEWLRQVHVFYVKLGTTEEQVKSHVASVIGTNNITVETLKSRGQYASFKLAVPSTSYEHILAPESWPVNVCVKPWQQLFRQKSERQT